MNRVFGLTRFLVVLGVLSSLILSAVIFIAGLIEALEIVLELVTSMGHEAALKDAAVSAIQLTDHILIAAALYIIAAGLYELFIARAHNLPSWLIIQTFEDLKYRLLGVSVAVMVVSFVAEVATWEGERNLMIIGLPVAAVVIAIGVFTYLSHRSGGGGRGRTNGDTGHGPDQRTE
jgi:uncharacterized membrane protein YqhA